MSLSLLMIIGNATLAPSESDCNLKKCFKMCHFGRMPYFPEIDKTQKSGLLGERLWVYSLLVQFLREGDSL